MVEQRLMFELVPDVVFSDTRVSMKPSHKAVQRYTDYHASSYNGPNEGPALARGPQKVQWVTKLTINHPELYFDSMLDMLLPLAVEQCRKLTDEQSLKAALLQRRGNNDPNSTPAPKI